MSEAGDYARRFAAWARARRDALARRYRCAVCGATDGELHEHAGRLYCVAHDPTALPASGRREDAR